MREKLRRMHAWFLWACTLFRKLFTTFVIRLIIGPRTDLLRYLLTEAYLSYGLKKLIMQEILTHNPYTTPEQFLARAKDRFRQHRLEQLYGRAE